jgi:hypothetical protein
MVMKWFGKATLAGLATVAGLSVTGNAFGQYYGQPHCNGRSAYSYPHHSHSGYSSGYGGYSSGYGGYGYGGYQTYRPIVVAPNYGFGNNYSSFYRGYNGVGGLTPSWGGYGMGGFPVGGSYGGGGAFPRGGSYGGRGVSLYIGR